MDDSSDRSRTSSARQQHNTSVSASDPHSAYGAGQPYNTPLSYQSDYSPDPQSRQPSYQSAAFTTNTIYNPIPPQNQQQYSTIQSYPAPRHQTAAIEVLSSQFAGAPQQYYPGNDSPIAAVVTPHSHHPSQSQFSSPTYGSQYSPTAQRAPLPYAQAPELHQQAPTSEPSAEEDPRQSNSSLEEAYEQYQDALKRIFINMRDGRLEAAGTSLITISEWLLRNAVDLGLVRDDEKLVAERTKLWNEFNTCWLSVLIKEKEMLQEYLATGQEPQPPQELLRVESLEQMGRDIVKLCDDVEQHGLVDYQMGVWEEEIIDALTECLDLWESINTTSLVTGNA